MTNADWFGETYQELRMLAEKSLRGQSPDHTLQPTALVNEAWMKMAGTPQWNDRTHFVAVAATAMRQVLIDYARARACEKRGGGRWSRVTLSGRPDVRDGDPVDIIALDEALTRLAEVDPRQARIIEMRFFGGLATDEIATVSGVSRRTVELDLQMARAWLARELSDRDARDVVHE